MIFFISLDILKGFFFSSFLKFHLILMLSTLLVYID